MGKELFKLGGVKTCRLQLPGFWKLKSTHLQDAKLEKKNPKLKPPEMDPTETKYSI